MLGRQLSPDDFLSSSEYLNGGDDGIYIYGGVRYKKSNGSWSREYNGKFLALEGGNIANRVKELNKNAKRAEDKPQVDEWDEGAIIKRMQEGSAQAEKKPPPSLTTSGKPVSKEPLGDNSYPAQFKAQNPNIYEQEEDLAAKEKVLQAQIQKEYDDKIAEESIESDLSSKDIYRGYPGKEGKAYKLVGNHWFEAKAAKPTYETIVQPGGGTITRQNSLINLNAFSTEQEWVPIKEKDRLLALNNYFKKEASLDAIDEVFTNFDDTEEKKYNLYKIDNGEWKRLIPGAAEYSTVSDKNAISALNERYGKDVEYKEVASPTVKEEKLKFADINSSLTAKTEESAVAYLDKKYKDYGFSFSQEGLFNIDRVRVTASNRKEITVEFDEKNPDEALKLRNFLEQNASKRTSDQSSKISKRLGYIRKSFEDSEYDISRAIPTDNVKTQTEIKKYYNSEEYKNLFKSLSLDEMRIEVDSRTTEHGSKYKLIDGPLYDIYKKKKEEQYNINDQKIKSLYEQLSVAETSGNKELKKQVKSKIDTYLTEEIVQGQVLNYNIHLNDLANSGKKLKDDINQYEVLVEIFNKSAATMSREVYESQKKILEDKAEALEIRRDNISTSFNNIEKSQKKINVVAGEYIKSKAQIGSFGGGVLNSVLTGIVKIVEPLITGSMQGYNVANDVRVYTDVEEEKYYKDQGYTDKEIRNISLNEIRKRQKKGLRGIVIGALGSETTKEYMSSKDVGLFEKAIYGVAESAPAMLAGFAGSTASFSALASQAYSSIEDEMLDDPDFKTTSAADRAIIAVPYAVLMGVLENYGLKNAVKGESFSGGLFKGIISRSLKKMPDGFEKIALEKIINKEVKSLIGKGVMRIANGTLAEFETGATQSLVLDIGLKALYNTVKGKKMRNGELETLTGDEYFTTPASFSEGATRVWEDGLMEAIGGMTISTFGTVTTGIMTGNISLYNEKDLKFLKEMSTDKEFKKIIVANLKSDILTGKLTKSEAEAELQNMNEFSGMFESIPDDISPEDQIKSINLVSEKIRLTKQREGKDPALVAAQTDRINKINDELKTISKNATKETTEQQQAGTTEGGVSEYQGTSEGQQEVGVSEGGQRQATVNETDSGDSTISSKVQEEVATYRSEEQAELLKAIPKIESYKVNGEVDKTLMPKTVLDKYNKIYNKYDKLISPLLETTTEITIDKPAIATNTTAEVGRVKSLNEVDEDGATFNIDGVKYEGPGLVVPVISMNTTMDELTPDMISNFVEEHSDKIGDSETVKVGIYKFPNSNQVSIDLNILAPESSRGQAIEFGRLSGQESLFDMSTFENVKTGATGENPMEFTPQQFKEIAKALKEGRMPNVFGTQEVAAKTETKKAEYKQNLVTTENSREMVSRQDTPLKQKIVKSAAMIMRSLPGVKVYLHNNKSEMHQAIADTTGRDVDDISNEVENAAGAQIKKEIHINMETAKETTILHEAFHEAILRSGKSFQTITDFANGLKNIISDKEVKAKLDKFISMYKESDRAEEFLSELGAIMSEAETELTTTKFQKFLNLINRIAKSLGLPVIIKSSATAQEAVDFINYMSKSLMTGKAIEGDYRGEGKIKKQATEIMKGNESLEKFGLKKGKNITRKIGEALEARQRAKYGTISQKDNSPEARKKISNWMVDEVKYFIGVMGDKSGKGWYGKLYQKSLDRMSKIFPEMKTDQNARDLFTMLVAITSDGQKVMSNFKLASEAYDYYKKNGVMPITLSGNRVASFEANLKRINDLLVEYNGDIAAIKKDLMDVRSIQDINKERKKEGLAPLKTSWPVSFKAPFAASVFGAKLGMFFSNLSGNEAYPTLDRWWSRTFNRYRGTLIPTVNKGFNTKGEAIGLDRFKALLGNPEMNNEEALLASRSYRDSYAAKGYKNGTEVEKAANTIYKAAFENINDAPFNSSDRQFMYDTISDAVNKLNKQGYDLSIADTQAILWYFEKNLYKTLGVQANIEGISYEDAANYTYDKWKSAGEKFNYEIKAEEEGQAVEDEDIDDTEQPSKIKQQKTGVEGEISQEDGKNIFYPKESLGLKRSEMPQIRTRFLPILFDKLKNDKISFEDIDGAMANTLKPSQNEINIDNTDKFKNDAPYSKKVIVSSDNYIIDGHHRWYYSSINDLPIDITKIDLPIQEALNYIKQLDFIEQDEIGKIKQQKTQLTTDKEAKPGYDAALESLGQTKEQRESWRKNNKVNQKQKRNPIVEQAAKDYYNELINQEEYLNIVSKNQPIKSFKEVPTLPSLEDITNSLDTSKVATGIIGLTKNLEDGEKVASRLDIPAYEDYDTWVVSIHDGNKEGKSIAYGQTAVLKNVDFKTFPGPAIRIAMDTQNKSTIARMFGDWVNEDPEAVYARAKELMNDPAWTQVGMNPFRHSWFYDKTDGMPLASAEEVIQVGALVLAKNAKKISPSDPMFETKSAKGGKIKFQKTPQETRMDKESEDIFKKSLDRGTTWPKATQNALDYIQKSKWYQDATDIEREQKIRDFKQSKSQKLKKAPSVAKVMGTPKPKMVTVNEAAAFKDQLRLEAKAAREAKADLNSKRKSLSDAIKGMVKLGKLKVSQASTIIKRVSQVNLDNPVMVERLIDYAAKVFDRADYQERLNNAFSYRRAIKRLLKSDNQAQVVGMANEFAKIDPSMVENIDDYIDMAEIVKNAVAPSRVKGLDVVLKESANIETVSNFSKDALEKQDQKLKAELLAINNDLLESGVISGDMTIKEIQEILNAIKDPEYKMDSKEKERYVRSYLLKRFESLASIVTDIIKTNQNPFTGEQVAITVKDRAIISDLLKVDLSEMSIRDAIFAVEAMDNFINNGITSKLEGALSAYKGQLGLKEQIKSGKVARALKLYFSPRLGRIFGKEFTPLSLMIERMFSGVKSGISVMKSMGLDIVINGVNKANYLHNKIINEYYEKFIKNSKTFHNPENVYERGMLSFLKRNVTGSLEEMKAETNRRVNLITQSIDVLNNYGDKSQKTMAEVYQKVFDKLGVSTGDMDVINSNASKENRDAVDWWVDQWSKHYKDLHDVSLSIYNYDLGSDVNYTPDQFKILKTKSIDKELLERNSSFLISMDKVIDKTKTGVLMESTRPTTMEVGRYVSLDFDSNNSNSLKGALVDINTAAGIRQVDGFLNSNLLNKLIPTAKDRELLETRVNIYKRRAKGKIFIPSDLYKDADAVLNFAASLGVGKALGGVLQSVKQTVPIAISTAMMTGKFNIATLEFNEWLNNTGMPISNRGIESLSTIESIDRRMEAKGTKFKDSLKTIQEVQQLYVKFFLSRPDVFIARSGFQSYYLQYMGESSIDWADHKPNQDALNYAQSMVDRQQNISDPMLGGEFLTAEDGMKRMAKKILFPFASFGLNQKARLNSDIINIGSKTTSNEDRKIAYKSAAATVAEMVAYRAISVGIGIGLYKVAKAIVLGILGDDDDDDEDDKKMLESATKFPVKSMINDIISPIQMTDRYVTMSTDLLLSFTTGYNESELDELVKQENEIRSLKDEDPMDKKQEDKFRQEEKQKSLYQVGSKYDDNHGLGMISIASDLYKKIYNDYSLAITGEFEDEYKGNITIKKIRPVEQDLMKNTLYFSTLFAMGILPKESDQIVTKVVNMVKKNAMSESEYTKYEDFKKEFKREPSQFEMGMIKSDKEYEYISKDINWVNRGGGLNLAQGREYVKLLNTLGEVTGRTLLEIKAGKTADQIVKSMRAKL